MKLKIEYSNLPADEEVEVLGLGSFTNHSEVDLDEEQTAVLKSTLPEDFKGKTYLLTDVRKPAPVGKDEGTDKNETTSEAVTDTKGDKS